MRTTTLEPENFNTQQLSMINNGLRLLLKEKEREEKYERTMQKTMEGHNKTREIYHQVKAQYIGNDIYEIKQLIKIIDNYMKGNRK
mgnify:CR=1 FL=1